MIIASTEEEKDLIERITPVYAVKDKYIISSGDAVYHKKIFASFPTFAMIYAPDFYVEERIARKLIRMRLDISRLEHIGYYRIMDTSIEEIVLYNLNKPHMIPLNLGKREGLFDRMGRRVETGVMQSFEVPIGNENIADSYNHIREHIDPDKTYGLINASESAVDQKNNIVAIFEIIGNHKLY